MVSRLSLRAAVSIMVLAAACSTDEVPTTTILPPALKPVAADNSAAVQARIDAGIELREAGSPEEAIARYDEAIRLDPRTHLLMCYERWLTPGSATTKRPSKI